MTSIGSKRISASRKRRRPLTEHRAELAHHFHDLHQQRESAELGMWLFLATEVMFFGGLFLAYFVYRWTYPEAFTAGSLTMDVWLGTINTGVLLTSSLTMVLAGDAAARRDRVKLASYLLVTAILGAAFLGVKAYEYHHKFEEGHIPFLRADFIWPAEQAAGASTFFNLYFLMTGLHAFHMIIGIVILVGLAFWAYRGGLLDENSIIVHNLGLYWHFVDLVWVYLFPLFYLVAARSSS